MRYTIFMNDEERKNDILVEESVEDKDKAIPATTYDENGRRKHTTRKNLGMLIIKHLPRIAFAVITITFIVGFILLIKSFF